MTHREIILRLGGPARMAEALGCKTRRVEGWRNRDSIPAKHWPEVVKVSADMGVYVSFEMLAQAMQRSAA